ncbi:hypothetical protein DFH06DRAFT_310377 [Mycena polygramma]|nr:hypothetical protein DFH06DRAFT_310377 [Mycena polygramma]
MRSLWTLVRSTRKTQLQFEGCVLCSSKLRYSFLDAILILHSKVSLAHVLCYSISLPLVSNRCDGLFHLHVRPHSRPVPCSEACPNRSPQCSCETIRPCLLRCAGKTEPPSSKLFLVHTYQAPCGSPPHHRQRLCHSALTSRVQRNRNSPGAKPSTDRGGRPVLAQPFVLPHCMSRGLCACFPSQSVLGGAKFLEEPTRHWLPDGPSSARPAA